MKALKKRKGAWGFTETGKQVICVQVLCESWGRVAVGSYLKVYRDWSFAVSCLPERKRLVRCINHCCFPGAQDSGKVQHFQCLLSSLSHFFQTVLFVEAICLLFSSVTDPIKTVDIKHLAKLHYILVIYSSLHQGRFQALIPRKQWSKIFWRWLCIWLEARKRST